VSKKTADGDMVARQTTRANKRSEI